ncbi:hypothetical protein Pst134EB_008899 [Puccinia striiformis f. sp. tritici]|nr:hypothetical protein Pst134EB_008899 [Puccinia striiformis f. sp. tritici]
MSWLEQVLGPYPAKQAISTQITQTLASYSSLAPKTEPFTFDDGRTALLLKLSGTIPVNYRRIIYNLPIAIWLPFSFPADPPILYLTPTNEMVIRPSSNVDPSGRINLDQHWNAKPEAGSLNRTLEYLTTIFADHPPLYSKPTRPPLPPQLTSSSLKPIPPPPQAKPRPIYSNPPIETLKISSPQNLLDDDDEEPLQQQKTAPPRPPPNPETSILRQKVYEKLKHEIARYRSDLDKENHQLEILEQDLYKGEPAIKDELARLEAVNDVCMSVGKRYSEIIGDLHKRIFEVEARSLPDVDELVCSTTVLYNQLWELILHDKVIDDTVYTLSKSLNSSDDEIKINLDKFLKRIRILGHQQFLIRVKINHIQQQLGSSSSSSS